MKKSELQLKNLIKENVDFKSGYYLVTNSFRYGPPNANWGIKFTKGNILNWDASRAKMLEYRSDTDEWVNASMTDIDFIFHRFSGGNVMVQQLVKNTKRLSEKEMQNIIKQRVSKTQIMVKDFDDFIKQRGLTDSSKIQIEIL